jgi:hypothetical protein
MDVFIVLDLQSTGACGGRVSIDRLDARGVKED